MSKLRKMEQVYTELGRHEDSFLDLQHLHALDASIPGLFQKRQEAALRCLRGTGNGHSPLVVRRAALLIF